MTNGTPIELAREADFVLGALQIRPAAREVEGAAGQTTLEPRVMQVLVALARQPRAVVSRDELIARCWSGRVVGDDAVHRCIARLRRLAESHGGFAVETVPKVGYRLIPDEAPPLPAVERSSVASPPQRWRLALGAAAAVAVVAAAVSWRGTSLDTATQASTVAAVVALARDDRYAEAFRLGLPLVEAGRLEEDDILRSVWQEIALPMQPLVAEDGATVYFKGYSEADAEWIEAGVTPFARPVDAPRGTLRLKVTKPGFRTGYFAIANPGPSVVSEASDGYDARRGPGIPLPLVELGSVPDGMVVVPRTDVRVWVPGWATDRQGSFRREIPQFLIARSEVTNRQFKEFIDAGGYDDPAYWEDLKFIEDGRELTWAEARTRFVDSTHRPGPAEWQLSTYPAGQESFPVGGISWYEAMAYARFRGQTLPTIHHWARAAFAPFDPRFNVAPAVAIASRFSAPGPVPADAEVGLGPWGTFNMAGNVREWLWNFAADNALAPGGAWTDYAMENWGTYPLQPMDRSPTNGMRLMQTPADTALLRELREPIHRLTAMHPVASVSDETFATMRMQFEQGSPLPTETNTSVVAEAPLWVAEEVVLTFTAAEPVTLYIVRPRSHVKPLQPIVFAPAANCCLLKRPNREALELLQDASYVVDGGRALIIPIWSGSYQRFQPPAANAQLRVDRERDLALAWRRDIRVVLDHLETRSEIDSQRAGFVGASIGAFGQGIVLALEPRLKAAVLISAGVWRYETTHPLADIANYAPRITVPVLMINGRMDHLMPYVESQQALLHLLGTADSAKRHIAYEGGHYQYRRNFVARAVTDWFDEHLGSPR